MVRNLDRMNSMNPEIGTVKPYRSNKRFLPAKIEAHLKSFHDRKQSSSYLFLFLCLEINLGEVTSFLISIVLNYEPSLFCFHGLA